MRHHPENHARQLSQRAVSSSAKGTCHVVLTLTMVSAPHTSDWYIAKLNDTSSDDELELPIPPPPLAPAPPTHPKPRATHPPKPQPHSPCQQWTPALTPAARPLHWCWVCCSWQTPRCAHHQSRRRLRRPGCMAQCHCAMLAWRAGRRWREWCHWLWSHWACAHMNNTHSSSTRACQMHTCSSTALMGACGSCDTHELV